MATYGTGVSDLRTTLVAVRTRDTLFIAPVFLPVALLAWMVDRYDGQLRQSVV